MVVRFGRLVKSFFSKAEIFSLVWALTKFLVGRWLGRSHGGMEGNGPCSVLIRLI